MSPEKLLETVGRDAGDPTRSLEAVLRGLGADTGTVHLMGEDGLLHLKAWAGSIPDEMLPIIRTIPVGKGIAGLAVERKEPVDICNLQTDSSGQARPKARETGVKGSICVPMLVKGEAVGALGVATVRERVFTEDEVAMLLEVGRILGRATRV